MDGFIWMKTRLFFKNNEQKTKILLINFFFKNGVLRFEKCANCDLCYHFTLTRLTKHVHITLGLSNR